MLTSSPTALAQASGSATPDGRRRARSWSKIPGPERRALTTDRTHVRRLAEQGCPQPPRGGLRQRVSRTPLPGPLPPGVLGGSPQRLPHGRTPMGDHHLKVPESRDNLRSARRVLPLDPLPRHAPRQARRRNGIPASPVISCGRPLSRSGRVQAVRRGAGTRIGENY
jgi:hypothetical protein